MKVIVKHEPTFQSSMKRHGLPWTQDEDLTLRAMAAHGDPLERIAHVVHRSATAVLKRWEFISGLDEDLYPQAYLEDGQFDPRSRRPLRDSHDLPGRFTRQSIPARPFVTKWHDRCKVCGQGIPAGQRARSVAKDKLAHEGCW